MQKMKMKAQIFLTATAEIFNLAKQTYLKEIKIEAPIATAQITNMI
jgi:hypothetical protein